MSNQILLVDDDQKCRRLLSQYLSVQGCLVDAVNDEDGMNLALAESSPDLVILDLAFSGGDELSITRRLQVEVGVPVIIISSKSDEMERIIGLEMGADDYIIKPVNPRELLARVRSVLRLTKDDELPVDENIITFGGYQMDLGHYSLTCDGETVQLNHSEFELLRHLAEHPNHTLSRNHLLYLLDDDSGEWHERSIDVRITRIRKKIEKDPHHPKFIKTVRGEGYLFSAA